MAQPPALPAHIEASAAIARHAGCKPFLSGAWLSAAAARLGEDDKRLFGSLLAHFRSGNAALPDLNAPVELADDESDKVHRAFACDGQRDCKAVCLLDKQGEVLRIGIHAPNRTGELVLTKPGPETMAPMK